MIKASIFEKIGAMVSANKARELASYNEFIAFYRELVEALPSDVTKIFGSMPVGVFDGGAKKEWNIQLTAVDYIWWKSHIEGEGVRFTKSPARVQLDMLDRISKKAEVYTLDPSERKALIALLEEAQKQAA